MRTSRLATLLTLLGATSVGCGGDSTGPSSQVSSVEVTPATGTLEGVGTSVQFSAAARDADGKLVSGKSATWSTSNAAVATVSSTGLATAVSLGSAVVNATIDGVSGSAQLTVTVASQACANAQTVQLSVGQARTFDRSACFVLPSGVAGDRYRVAVVRPATAGVETDVITVTLKVAGLGVTQAPVPVSVRSMVAPASAGLAEAVRVADATERFHLRLRNHDADLAREAGYDLLPRRPSLPLSKVVATADSPAKMEFDISTGSTCERIPNSKRTGVLIQENDDVVLYQDSAQNVTKPVSVGLAQKMTTYFSAYVKDMVAEYWGDITDIDGNGKVVVFATPIVSSDVAAFVWSGDFYTKSSCSASNEKELIYFNTDLILDMEGSGASYQALHTLGHEAKHLVSLYNRIGASQNAGTSQFHPGWIEEGTAEISGEMAARLRWAAGGGPGVGELVTDQAFKVNGSNRITEDNYGVSLHLARTVWYLSGQPNGLVVTPTGAIDDANIYGSGWLFHRWLGDAYGGAASAPMADAPLFKALTAVEAPAGTAGLEQQTGRPFLTLYEEFVNAIQLHRTSAPEPPRAFTTFDFLSTTGIFSTPNPDGDFPWPVTTVGETATATFQSATYSGRIGVSGIRIHDFLSNGTGTGAQISLDTGGQPAKIQVVRLR